MCKYSPGNLTEPESLRGPCDQHDTVFHLARYAHAGVKNEHQDRLGHEGMTVSGTLSLLCAAQEAKIRHIVYASSAQAMTTAWGRALFATDMPGCREIARHGVNGLLAPARDARALAAVLNQLILDSTLRQRMGKRIREIAEAEFSVERVNADTLALYKEVLA